MTPRPTASYVVDSGAPYTKPPRQGNVGFQARTSQREDFINMVGAQLGRAISGPPIYCSVGDLVGVVALSRIPPKMPRINTMANSATVRGFHPFGAWSMRHRAHEVTCCGVAPVDFEIGVAGSGSTEWPQDAFVSIADPGFFEKRPEFAHPNTFSSAIAMSTGGAMTTTTVAIISHATNRISHTRQITDMPSRPTRRRHTPEKRWLPVGLSLCPRV